MSFFFAKKLRFKKMRRWQRLHIVDKLWLLSMGTGSFIGASIALYEVRDTRDIGELIVVPLWGGSIGFLAGAFPPVGVVLLYGFLRKEYD